MMAKKLTIVASLVLAAASQTALADGFRCRTLVGDLNVRVYNKTLPEEGTRNGGVLVLANPAVHEGNQTIAKFLDVKNTLSNVNSVYEADVDLRVRESARGGELISGTKLKYLDTIILDVDFSYSNPIPDGEATVGELTLVKRNGQKVHRNLECVRYLKG